MTPPSLLLPKERHSVRCPIARPGGKSHACARSPRFYRAKIGAPANIVLLGPANHGSAASLGPKAGAGNQTAKTLTALLARLSAPRFRQ